MRFSEVLASVSGSAGAYGANVPESWAQGRTLFGGLQVALALRAMRLELPNAAPLRTVQVVFIAPVPPGQVTMQVRLLRAGKSASQVEARILDGGQLACLVVAIFGAARESVVNVAPTPPTARPADQCPPAPYLPGVLPVFLQHCEMRWAKGSPPFMGKAEPQVQIYARLLGETAAADECTVAALADFPPPLGLAYLKKPAPGSSMTWTLDFIGQDFSGEGSWLLDGELIAASGGYLSQSFTVWSPNLKPVALSRQAMVIFG